MAICSGENGVDYRVKEACQCGTEKRVEDGRHVHLQTSFPNHQHDLQHENPTNMLLQIGHH